MSVGLISYGIVCDTAISGAIKSMYASQGQEMTGVSCAKSAISRADVANQGSAAVVVLSVSS